MVLPAEQRHFNKEKVAKPKSIQSPEPATSQQGWHDQRIKAVMGKIMEMREKEKRAGFLLPGQVIKVPKK